MLLLPQRQRFQSLQKQERVERTQRRADVAQQRDAHFQDERHVAHAGDVAQGVPVFQTVIARIGFGEFGELAVVPLEFAGVHDHAADARAVTADVFRGRRDNDVRAKVKRPHQADTDRVVHNERKPGLVCDFRDCLKVRHVELRIADGLDVNGARLRRDGLAKCLGVARVHKLRRAAEFGQRVMEKLVGAAVKVVARHDFIPHPRDGQQRESDGRRAGCHAERARAAFDRRDPLLEDIGGRVHDPRVNVAEFLQRKKIRGVLGAFENIRGGLVNRNRPRAGGRIHCLSRVQGQCFELLVGHGVCFSLWVCLMFQ